ncbi:unnamed protein product [Prunus armeniaca]|uniref:Flavodoxin-like domain-containing protein n=1 Tax=Prunus armeniaca TaxID=36596 RepID=A0A6J5VF31_PRUAR|nr:unnamed protein product [Prunus armeniaca]
MGKGGGCVPSKKKVPSSAANPDASHPNASQNAPPIPTDDNPNSTTPSRNDVVSAESHPNSHPAPKLRIFIVFYSMYGHVEDLARRMKKGVDGVDGVEGLLYRVPETLPSEVLEAMKAPPKDTEIPEISAAELAAADGVLFGFPTRYGSMAAQMKAFFRLDGAVVEGADPRWEACWVFCQYWNSRRRPRNHCVSFCLNS